MPVPCEFAVYSVIPAFKALIARELYSTFHLNQGKIGALLHVTQSAVSQYHRKVRGTALNLDTIDDVRPIVSAVARGLATESLTLQETTYLFCQVCRLIREHRLLCTVHQRIDLTFNIVDCDVCMPPLCTK